MLTLTDVGGCRHSTELLERSVGTTSPLSFSTHNIRRSVVVTFWIVSEKGGAGFDGRSEKESALLCVWSGGAQSMPNPLA